MRRLALLLGLVSAALAGEQVSEPFNDNANRWRLDARWKFVEGSLQAQGLAGQVLAVGGDLPEVADFTATLTARKLAGDETGNYGFGLLYRYDAASRNGCFVAIGAGGGYGFGRVEGGRFGLLQQGRSRLVQPASGAPLELSVRGDQHTLRLGGTLVDLWRDASRRSGTVGLVVIEAVEVAFDELAVEYLTPPPRLLGPAPPDGASSPQMLSDADVAAAIEWRQHFNAMQTALGQPLLPAELDLSDLWVLALLKDYHLSAVAAPAGLLVDWSGLQVCQELGAVGVGPAAAVEFWWQYQAVARAADQIGGQEDLLAGLTWYFATRARLAAGWTAGEQPLRLPAERQAALDEQRRRFERQGEAAARDAQLAGWARLSDEVLTLLRHRRERP
ncbi:MAG: hypothetical protein IT204_23900 [Fimbriimonadaceae bacterium]|nr:hypothetical protein [Fimbriimonadaceae bacterium]